MASSQDDGAPQQQASQLLLRADEVDAGTTIPTTSDQVPLSALTAIDVSGTSTAKPVPPPRPVLRREGSAAAVPPPPPPSQPPPAPPALSDNVTDSLSLPQLRQLVAQFPKTEQHAYAYQYRDAEDFVVEIDEWFHYTDLEQDREYLLTAREAFEQRWRSYCENELRSDDASWIELDAAHRARFLSTLISDLSVGDVAGRFEALATLYYTLTGVWSMTAGLEPVTTQKDEQEPPEKFSALQVIWIHKGVDVAIDCDVVSPIYNRLRSLLEQPINDITQRASIGGDSEVAFDDVQYREISLCLSCLYMIVESARSRGSSTEAQKVRRTIASLQPNLAVYLVSVIARLRWDESYNIPLLHALQLLWKVILVSFGGVTHELEEVKALLQPRVDPFSSEAAHPVLTASPLDYHVFRQEITSKYPAYNPPPPLIPLEIEQKTMLPPPPTGPRHDAIELMAGSSSAVTGTSILHQPVHIATPAPSPPPSPAGPGGKAGKKQNYQTNQNFPFLYPPLDSASNNIGGKGTTEFQDTMVGRKWEGSDIPASIIEAGELFASRMRMTRAMRQLWSERDTFMKYDRGWNADIVAKSEGATTQKHEQDEDKLTPDLSDRLNAVKTFFHYSLPDLQSLVIVMMKVMLTNVQDIVVKNGNLQESQVNGLNRTKSNPNMAQGQSLPVPPAPPRPTEVSLEDLDQIRSREISQKTISGTLFLLLKWFKVAHILQFEYMTQLLLDSNYIQLTLKYFAHQNLEDLVAFSYDRQDLSFWHYCHQHSDHPPLSPTSLKSPEHSDSDEARENSDIDDAVPPPIQRHRRSPTSNTDFEPMTGLVASPEQAQSYVGLAHPSVDELGNPLAPLPQTPISEFSARQFQTSIHLLRTLQKLTRAKSHRILLLVQFKSSQILRRILRVPDPLLRLYVLKLFKSQVPYCGRKWRQSNMRVITAIYLHCRPELRDEWLAGMHDSNVEGDVDEAVPLEWALRGLTFWWMKRAYPDVMKTKIIRNRTKGMTGEGLDASSQIDKSSIPNADVEAILSEGGQEIEDEERDFFQRELDAMGWGLAGLGLGDGEDVGFGEEAPGASGPMSAIPLTANGSGHGTAANGDHLWENDAGMNMNISAWP